METTLLQIGKEVVFPKMVLNLAHSLNVRLAWILCVD